MPDRQENRIGQQIGEYRLVRKLGGGSFGTVYLTEHVHNHAQAAIKVLDIRLSKSEDFKDFINEASMIRLRHPHIVPLLNFGISRDDLPFLVMEYAPQGTLRDRHSKGERIPLSTIISYVDQLAPALQYAHDQRVIHRDVKPENILVRVDGTLLVSDFGIAKLLEQSVLVSQQTQVGTPVYMAPEQYSGYPCFASDQYALAVVVYEWICGVRPFQGPAIGLAVQHMNTPPPPLRNHLPTLPETVERVILKALAKAPEDRFGSIQEMASALREAVQPSPITVILSPPIEAMNTASLVPPEQVSQLTFNPKPETLVRAFTDTKSVRLKPAIQTADIPISYQRSTPAFPLTPPKPRTNAAFPSPQKRLPSKRLSLLIGGILGLVFVYFIGQAFLLGINTSTSSGNTQQPTTTKSDQTATTSPVTPTPTLPGQDLLDTSVLSNSFNEQTGQVLQQSTDFKVNQKIYVILSLHPGGNSHLVCLDWYLNDLSVNKLAFQINPAFNYKYYSYAIMSATGKGHVDILLTSTTACTDAILAQELTFTVN